MYLLESFFLCFSVTLNVTAHMSMFLYSDPDLHRGLELKAALSK